MKGYFSIWGYYHGKWEKIDQAGTSDEALYLQREYQITFGTEWTIEIRHKGKSYSGEEW